MPDTVVEPFDIKKFFSGFLNPTTWSKTVVYLILGAIIVIALIGIKNFFFPTRAITNKPIGIAVGHVEKGAIDQTSTNIVVEKEKDWTVGAGVGGGRFDGKDGYAGGAWISKKF